MKTQINIDLRKQFPLGVDVDAAWHAAKKEYQTATDMGPGDRSKPRYQEHNRHFHDLIYQARLKHGLLRVIDDLVGPDIAEKIPALRWATVTDMNGKSLIQR